MTLITRPAGAAGISKADGSDAVSSGATSADPAAADPAASNDQTLLLEVEVNGHPSGLIGEFTLRRGILMTKPQELRDLGFRVSETNSSMRGGLIPLSSVAGLTWQLDEKNQVLYIVVADSGLTPTVLTPMGGRTAGERRTIESGTGTTLNYDIVNSFSGSQKGATASLDMRAFSPFGVASSGWLAYAGSNSGGAGANRAVRLDSAYTFADVNSLRRYSLGDFVTSGLAWTRPVHLEGVQVRSDFSMRPDLVTFPMPVIAGSAAVPSTVSVLADGNQVVSGQVGAGPFEVPELPVISGAGMVSMTVTNSMGQQVTISQPFYVSSSLLIPGLQTFSAQAGLVRRNWGSASYDYGKAAGAAVYRRGLTRKFTLEASTEGTPGAFVAGGGGVLQVGTLGVVNFAAAGSAGGSEPGGQLSAGIQRIGRVFSAGGSALIASRNYRDIATMNGDGALRKQLSAFMSVSSVRLGSVGVGYGGVDQGVTPIPFAALAAPEHSHVFSASYSVQLRHMSVYASEFKDVSGTSGSNGLQAGVVIPFGRRNSVDIGATSDGTATLEVQQPAPEIGNWGYQAYVAAGHTNHAFVEAQVKSPVGLFSAGADTSDGQSTFRLESQGALSLVDRGFFASNEIYDSFAIVDTGPIHHVRVMQENREVGRTDSSGRLLVPDMRSFDLNHITIEPTDIPADVTINNDVYEMRPQDRSGVVVKFPIKFSHGALLRLVDEKGEALPLGSAATLKATGAVVPIGYDGDAYMEDLKPHNELVVELADGRHCRTSFNYKPMPGEIPSIGPLRCVEARP
ncbi:MAG TPA: fimbria/pilus outer membrane usher protein [Terracidiphilus sp.]